MNIFICGLGLIGGSIAKAVKAHTFHTVIGFDRDAEVSRRAEAEGVIDRAGQPRDLAECDIVIVALYPDAAAAFVGENLKSFKANAILVDTCGIKTEVAVKIAALVKGTSVRYIGGHPMAGTERSGYENAFAELFTGASMILCPEYCDDKAALDTLSELFLGIGFGRITVSTCKHHDEVIAFTSQLAHVVSSAYIHGRLATEYSGFAAGSFADMTRVARLSADMWTELFFENRENLSDALGELIGNLESYKAALDKGDRDAMHALLAEGNARKIESEKLQFTPKGKSKC